MDIAFILDPLETLKVYKDSSYAMMREAARRGHRIHAILPGAIALAGGTVTAQALPLELTGDEADWYRAGAARRRPLADFGAVLLRKDPPFDLEYLYLTHLLEMAERQGARVWNRPGAVRDYNEKLAAQRFPAFTPETLVTPDAALIRDFLAEHGDVVLKPLDGMGGSGIFRLRPGDPNLSAILEASTELGRRTVMVQRYLPAIAEGDKRVLVIAGEPAPYCLARIPQPGETRGNLAAGGRGVARPLTDRDRAIGRALGPTLLAEGLFIVGLDVIGEHLTEVNVTSPTCMREIEDQAGFSVAAMVVDALERAAA